MLYISSLKKAPGSPALSHPDYLAPYLPFYGGHKALDNKVEDGAQAENQRAIEGAQRLSAELRNAPAMEVCLYDLGRAAQTARPRLRAENSSPDWALDIVSAITNDPP